MKGELSAVIETVPEGGFLSICLELPGAKGQGETVAHRMKRRDLERRPLAAGFWLKRKGSSDALWINPATGVIEAISRHTEIKESLARKMLNEQQSIP